MTQGERRTAERLEQKLDDDYLVWYDVPVGPKHAHPDFVVLHPSRGLLILEVKDWRLETIRTASKQTWESWRRVFPRTYRTPLSRPGTTLIRSSTHCPKITGSPMPTESSPSLGATASS
jgi:hypothetical protein